MGEDEPHAQLLEGTADLRGFAVLSELLGEGPRLLVVAAKAAVPIAVPGGTPWAEKDAPLKNPRVCLHDGYGEATATFAFMGFDAKLKMKGTMQLDGARPEAKIDSITLGTIPGFLTAPAERFVNSALDDVLDDVDLDHKYTPTITDGQVALPGTP